MSARLRTPMRYRQPGDPHSPLWVAHDLLAGRGLVTASTIFDAVADDPRVLNESPIPTPDGLIYPSLLRLFGLSPTRLVSASDIIEAAPSGLCGDRREHEPHLEDSLSLGVFWCRADQSLRLT